MARASSARGFTPTSIAARTGAGGLSSGTRNSITSCRSARAGRNSPNPDLPCGRHGQLRRGRPTELVVARAHRRHHADGRVPDVPQPSSVIAGTSFLSLRRIRLIAAANRLTSQSESRFQDPESKATTVVSRKYLYTSKLSFSACLAENPDALAL